jgi:hypothetical protein
MSSVRAFRSLGLSRVRFADEEEDELDELELEELESVRVVRPATRGAAAGVLKPGASEEMELEEEDWEGVLSLELEEDVGVRFQLGDSSSSSGSE